MMSEIKSVQFHEDDRAQRFFDVFDVLPGQVNISHVNSTEHVVAWHKHKKQVDYWFCIKGSFKVGLATEKDGAEFVYISDKNPRVLEIPPGVWHGYKALEPGSIMLYYLTEKYDVDDEWKVRPGDFGEEWGTESR